MTTLERIETNISSQFHDTQVEPLTLSILDITPPLETNPPLNLIVVDPPYKQIPTTKPNLLTHPMVIQNKVGLYKSKLFNTLKHLFPISLGPYEPLLVKQAFNDSN